MSSNFTIAGKDYFTTEVNDVVLDESATRRLIFRPEIVRNENDESASIHGTLMYQRKRGAAAEWEDVPPIDLRRVKAGESVGLYIDAAETKKLADPAERSSIT